MGRIAKETISGAKWGIIQKCTMQPVQFVYGIILARLITPAEFGILGLTSIFFAIAAQLQSCGFGSALIRDIDRTERDINTVFWTNIFLSAVFSGVLFLSAPLFAALFHQPALIWLTRASAAMMFLNATGSVHWTLYTCRRDFKTPALVSTLTTLAAMPVCLWTAYAGWGYWAVFLQGCVSGILSLVTIWFISPWKPRLMWSYSALRRYFAYGINIVGQGLVDSTFTNLRSLLIGKIYAPAALGLYHRAVHVAFTPMGVIGGMLSSVTFPILSTIQHDKENLLAVYSKYIRITSMGVFFFSFLLAAVAPPLVRLLYGEQWEPCTIYLQVLAIGATGGHHTSLNLNLLLVGGYSNIVFRLSIIRKLFSATLLVCAINLGILAVCIVEILVIPFNITVNSYYTKKKFGLGFKQQAIQMLPYFLSGILCATPAYLLTHSGMCDLLQLIAGVLSACSLYIVSLVLRKDDSFREVCTIFANSAKCPRFARKLILWLVQY